MMLHSRFILRATASGGRSNAQFIIPWSVKEREASTATSHPKSSKNKWIASAAGVISAVLIYRYYKSSDRKAFALKLEPSPSSSPQRLPGEYNDRFASYTMEEVAKHDNRQRGIWVTYKQGVYDITKFVDQHPGGSSKILMAAGGSIEPFWMIFSNHKHAEIYQLLESMRIGNISKDDAAAATSGMDDPYANEPQRHKVLIINNKKPFNAEPPAPLLTQSFHTPSDLFYVRNHLPTPDIKEDEYELEVATEDETAGILKLEDLKKYPKHTVTSAIMCAGNRRSEMMEVKPVKGLSWSVGAVGNATWSGARLRDVLRDLNINEDEYQHVQFEGLDLDPSSTPYGSSIPITKAMDPRGDVILAYEMNGEQLSRDHGYPVRVVVPGVVGARNVKWLGRINVSKHESESQWQQGDYKGFSPSTDWDTVDYSKSPAIQELPVISAICSPERGDKVVVENGKIKVSGYAWSGGGQKIVRVDVTADGGDSWETARFVAQDSAKSGRHWGWTLWEVEIPVKEGEKSVEIWSKAVDSSYNVQPESFKNIWNLRGVLNNAYHRVKVELT